MSKSFKDMDMGDFSEFKTTETDNLFGGRDHREVIGNLPSDPLTKKQLRMIFALGNEMGYSKDELKEAYTIESISSLTVKEATDLIEEMIGGVDDKKAQNITAQTELEKTLEWTRSSGVSRIDGRMAKCGHCINFSGENTLCDGKCFKKVLKGTYSGGKVIPMTEDCFEFKHGKLVRKTEKDVVMPSSDYNPDEDL